MKKIVLINTILFAFVLSNAICGCETPEETVKDYLLRDSNGERLSYKVSAGIDMIETENRFQPAWDSATLTTGFEIRSIKQAERKAVALVFFKNSWTVTGSAKFDPILVKDEIVEVHLVKVDGCWKVGPPFYRPHVHQIPLLNHYEELVRDAKRIGAGSDYINSIQSELDNVRIYTLQLDKK